MNARPTWTFRWYDNKTPTSLWAAGAGAERIPPNQMTSKLPGKGRKTILLTAGRIPGALELGRALGRAGHRVLIAECFRTHICRFSNTIAGSFRVTAPRHLDRFTQDILRIIEQENVDLLIPTCEEALHVAFVQHKIPAHCQVYVSSFDKIIRLHSKWEFIRWAGELGLPVPETTLISPEQERLPEEFHQGGYVLKPEFSRCGVDVRIIPPGTAARADLEKRDPPDRWIAQDYIAGRTLCAFAMAWRGKVLSTLTYEPTLTLGKFGVSFLRRDKPKIDAWVKEFVAKTGHHGFISVDFMEDEHKDVYAIECNPRITSGIHLAHPGDLLGVIDGPESKLAAGRAHRPRERAMVATAVLSVLPRVLRRRGMLKELVRSTWGSRDAIADLRDPLPFFHQFVCLLDYFRISLTKRIPLSACPCYLLEWTGEHTESGAPPREVKQRKLT